MAYKTTRETEPPQQPDNGNVKPAGSTATQRAGDEQHPVRKTPLPGAARTSERGHVTEILENQSYSRGTIRLALLTGQTTLST